MAVSEEERPQAQAGVQGLAEALEVLNCSSDAQSAEELLRAIQEVRVLPLPAS